jgi:ABC-2 type transport system ATP-binding protein
MRQKLIICGAFVHRPELIVVDEPMVGLDPKSARLLKDLFRQFVDRGGTILMSTHTLEIAEVMCDRVAIVYRGQVAAQGTMTDLREQTASGNSSLEDIFLKLTGGLREHQLDSVFEV